jgi:Alpha-kinase family
LNLYSLVEIVTITAQFLRPPLSPSFTELVKSPEFLLHPEKFPPLQVKISYQPSSKPLQGAFKFAHFGHTDIPLFGNSTQVCIKQTFFTSSSEDSPPNLKKHLVYKGQTQAANLSVELNCLGWASALMDLVYSFMKKEEPVYGRPPFEVPQMRYVKAGLAIEVSKDSEGTEKQNAYLLEEFIDSEDPGWFVKYLNNNSAKPHKFKDEERSIRAEFLSFSQHVQYIETGSQAYLSDLQGRSLNLTLSLDSVIIYL